MKVAPLLIFVVACGCARDADKPIAAGNAKTGLLTLPVIVVNGEICGTYSKYELRKGKYQQLGWVRPEHQFTLNKNGTFIWSREKVLREPGVAERWALRSLDYVGTGRWSKEGTLLELDGSEKIVQEVTQTECRRPPEPGPQRPRRQTLPSDKSSPTKTGQAHPWIRR
ncbi:MAG: hypothetical protein K8R88_03660 [Armatimonadetes bacterium]|nr:hypothetical protein [Armatimonadota bacterium]